MTNAALQEIVRRWRFRPETAGSFRNVDRAVRNQLEVSLLYRSPGRGCSCLDLRRALRFATGMLWCDGYGASPDGLRECRGRRDGGLPRKDLLQQHPMRFLVAVRAAIADDQQPVGRRG